MDVTVQFDEDTQNEQIRKSIEPKTIIGKTHHVISLTGISHIITLKKKPVKSNVPIPLSAMLIHEAAHVLSVDVQFKKLDKRGMSALQIWQALDGVMKDEYLAYSIEYWVYVQMGNYASSYAQAQDIYRSFGHGRGPLPLNILSKALRFSLPAQDHLW